MKKINKLRLEMTYREYNRGDCFLIVHIRRLMAIVKDEYPEATNEDTAYIMNKWDEKYRRKW